MDKNKSKQKLADLEAVSSQMMEDLSALSNQIKDIGASKLDEIGHATLSQLDDRLAALRQQLNSVGIDAKKVLGQVDQNVRTNPYIYILCALGLGFLLGKIRRS